MLVLQITEIEADNTLIEFGKFTGSTVADVLSKWYGTSYGDSEMFKWFCWIFGKNSHAAIRDDKKENYELVKELLQENMTEEDLISFSSEHSCF